MIRHMQGETIVTLEEFRQFKGEFEQALERKDMKFKFNGDVFLTADAKRAVANYPDHVLDGYDGVTLVHTNMEV